MPMSMPPGGGLAARLNDRFQNMTFEIGQFFPESGRSENTHGVAQFGAATPETDYQIKIGLLRNVGILHVGNALA